MKAYAWAAAERAPNQNRPRCVFCGKPATVFIAQHPVCGRWHFGPKKEGKVARKRRAGMEIFQSAKNGQWWWRLKGGNGLIVSGPEQGYSRRDGAKLGLVRAVAATLELVAVTGKWSLSSKARILEMARAVVDAHVVTVEQKKKGKARA